MTILWIQGEKEPLKITFPSAAEMTAAEFYDFCQANRELRIERLASGEVIVMPPAFSDTGNRNLKLAQQLANWADADGTGEAFDSSAGFTLPNGATRSPDAAWIRLDRWQALTPEQQASFAPICPDFVVELRSASDSITTLKAKMEEYLENGARLGWLIDRKNRRVHIYRPNQNPESLEDPDWVSGDPQLPGFRLQMARIW
ncbi:MAG TPA: Uma2 family endonuclease [Leptolyngbyaceae cyanobacterium M65_K2018_010]|nr:Uma2 family endonuclease [Leptolyngbyaceae cyanobacterium M65_K2018_010]